MVRRTWVNVNFQYRSVLLIWIIVGQEPTVLAVGAGGGCLGIFLSSVISLFFLPLSGSRLDIHLKYCLKGSFNPTQPTNFKRRHIYLSVLL